MADSLQDVEEPERHRPHARRDGEMHLLRAAHRGGEDRAARDRPGARTRTRFRIREFKTACQQACPPMRSSSATSATRRAACHELRESDRHIVMLEYLNTAPADELSRAHQESESENAGRERRSAWPMEHSHGSRRGGRKRSRAGEHRHTMTTEPLMTAEHATTSNRGLSHG